MRRTLLTAITGAGLLGIYASTPTYGAAPATAQGIITYRTHPGDARSAIHAGTATPDGTYYPKRMEGPYNGINVDAGDDPGDDDTRPPGDLRNNYTMELVGYFYPPKTGKIQFAMASDDPGELWFSTDDNPANKVKIASEPQWQTIRAFAAEARRTMVESGDAPIPRTVNQSAYINVTQGKPYFIQGIGVEYGGGDNTAVAFRYDTDAPFADGDLPIKGMYLSSIDRVTLEPTYLSKFASTPTGFAADIHDGDGAAGASLNASTVKAELDGAAVTVTTAKAGKVSTITYAKTDGYLASGSTHTAKITYTDSKSANVTVEKSFSVLSYGFLAGGLRSTADTTKPGFLWRVHQNAANTENSNAKSERILAALQLDADGVPLANQADPSAVGGARAAASAPNPAHAPITFEIETSINFDQGAGSNGAFTPDEQMPGIPGVDGSTDGIVAEILTWIEFPKGITWMGVNSDDGFKTTGGNAKDLVDAVFLGEFNGGRGAADTIFPLVAEEAGTYAIRTTWEEGGGGANIEWFTLKADGTKVLVNDRANGGLKSYRAGQGGVQSYLINISPFRGGSQVPLKPVVDVTFSDASSKIPQNSIKVKLDGTDATAAVSKAGDIITAKFTSTKTYKNGEVVNAELNFTNDGVAKSVTWKFVTEIDIGAPGTLFIETEDFDFGKGKWLDTAQLGMGGKYPGGQYFEKGDGLDGTANSDYEIDYFEAVSGSAQAIYRPTTGVEAGKKQSAVDGDPNPGIGRSRGSFDVEVNHVVGWNDAGDWMNYTRKFPEPAKTYHVFGRLSSGGAPIDCELAKVTSGAGTKQQTKQRLGVFRPGRATSGWDNVGAFEIFPLLSDTGDLAEVTLGGLTTLRFTTLSGNNDQDFIIFQESAGGVVPPVITRIARNANGTLTIEWTGGGTLQAGAAVTGPWQDVAGATSPYTFTPSGAGLFGRIKK